MFDTQNYLVATDDKTAIITFGGGKIKELGPIQETVDNIVSTFKFTK